MISYQAGGSVKNFKLLGFATGSYMNNCKSCNVEFFGDKLAFQCLDCAITEATNAHDAFNYEKLNMTPVFGSLKMRASGENIVESSVGKGELPVVPNYKQQMESLRDGFWEMLQIIEMRAKETDILDRKTVEECYLTWNRLFPHKANKPRWKK